MATGAMVELPWAIDLPRRALDAPPPSDMQEAADDPAAMTRGILVGLAISMPLWLGLAWLVASLTALLPTG